LQQVDYDKIEDFGFSIEEMEFNITDYVTIKNNFSKLIFLDKYEAIFNQPYQHHKIEYNINNLVKFKNKLKKDLAREKAKTFILDKYNLNKEKKIFTITAPTGIGKTLISLELALKIKNHNNYKKIIYAIPFTSIIDQIFEIFNSIFKNKITKHHHKTNYNKLTESDNNYDRLKFIVESWSEPFIVSTFYQLFYALFSNQNSDNIKFNSLEKSVIVLDEVQAIPHNFWKIFKNIITGLTTQLDCSFILMSATMPILSSKGTSIELADVKNIFANKNRYILKQTQLNGSNFEEKLEDLSQKIIKEYQKGKSVLCVVNTIKNSKLIYGKIKKILENDVYCLNSYMITTDRQCTLSNLKSDNSNNVKNKILIATQVIEAGVDLDFDVGFREIAPLSSIIQVAGRINREGNKEIANVYVFEKLGNYQIYNKSLENASDNTIYAELSKRDICEQEILNFIEKYFKQLHQLLGNAEEEFLKAIKTLNFEKIDNILNESFKSANNFTHSIAIGVDLSKLEQEYFRAKQTLSKWELKSFKEQQIKNITDKIINIKEKDIKNTGVNFTYSDIFGFLGCEFTKGIYEKNTGFLIKEEKENDKNSSFF